MSTKPRLTHLTGMITLAFTVACGCLGNSDSDRAADEEATSSEEEKSEEAMTSPVNDATVPTALPTVELNANCAGTPPEPSACSWITRHDAVVVGVVDAVRPFFEPGYRQSGGECEGANGGLELELTVAETLYGHTPQEIVVRIGPKQLQTWAPRPITRFSDKTFRWSAAGPTLESDMVIGLPLIEYPDEGVWSPTTSSLFHFPGGRLAFQPQGDDGCSEPNPSSLEKLTREEFAGLASGCDASEGAAVRQELAAVVARNPQYATHAECW